jgi:Tfp pilus assembly protein PilO
MMVRQLPRMARSPAALVIVALALLAFDAGFYWTRVEPALARNRALSQDLVQRRADAAVAKRAAPAPGADPQAELARFYAMLAPANTVQEVLERLHKAAAAEGLALQQAEYRPASESAGRLARHEIFLPLRGRYPEIRRFVSQAVRDIPGLALDSVSIQRANIGAETGEAQVRMTLFVEAGR